MIKQRLNELGYIYEPFPLERNFKGANFHIATKVNNLIFTSGQVSIHDNLEIKGKVGKDLTLEQAQKAAEIAAYNCLRAVGSLTDINAVKRVVKLLGMVNVADGFDQTSEVINGASIFLEKVFPDSLPARSAVGMVLPSNWAVEIEMIVEIEL